MPTISNCPLDDELLLLLLEEFALGAEPLPDEPV